MTTVATSPCSVPERSDDPTECCEDEDGSPQGDSPARHVDVDHHDAELQHDTADGDEAADLSYRPEAPVQLDEVLAVTVLDVEEAETLYHHAHDAEQKAHGCDSKVSSPFPVNHHSVFPRLLLSEWQFGFLLCKVDGPRGVLDKFNA